MKPTIFIIIVLYKKKLEDCLPFYFLMQSIKHYSFDYEILIYNNSPEFEIASGSDYTVINAPKNNMLSCAYNYALHLGIEKRKEWLLLLDQDTTLNENYLKELEQILLSDVSKKVKAIVPQIKKGDFFISPKIYNERLGISFFVKPLKESGVSEKCFMAINSGTVLSVKAMSEIGGFSKDYPLDGLDFWYFYQLHRKKKKIYVMNTSLQQNLSLLDYSSLSKDRYKSILDSELLFCKEIGFCAHFLWKLKIPLRSIKRLFFSDSKKYFLITLSYLFK